MTTRSVILAAGLAVMGLVSTGLAGEGEPRETVPLAVWEFTPDMAPKGATPSPPAQAHWSPVTIPHVFRQSGLPDDAAGWYRVEIPVGPTEKGKRFSLRLDGAATVKDVFVNGQFVGRHKGAYTASAFDLTPAVKCGQPNIIAIRVSNRWNEVGGAFARIILYYINGGMFRKAWLVKTGGVGIYPDNGSCGQYLTPGNLSDGSADLGIETFVQNSTERAQEVEVRSVVTDPQGHPAGTATARQTLAPGAIAPVSTSLNITTPQRWDIGRPNLYTVRTEVLAGGQPMDVLTEHTGFRTIQWNGKAFQLNGREVQFRGVNKHAQTEYAWNAVSDDDLRLEWRWLQDLGVDTVRLAHYPHSRLEYTIADQRGVVIWAENGFTTVSRKARTEDKAATADGERLTREMVRQLWNHPSILMWSCGNETGKDIGAASRYAAVIRGEKDPNRLVTYASDGVEAEHCDFVAHNTYKGWYKGNYQDFSKDLPEESVVSETGCGTWPSHHLPYHTIGFKVDAFEPEEYGETFTEYRLQTVCVDDVKRRPMFLWWNFREFYNKKFKDNRNTKGLVTLAGMPKDIYYLFQAFLNPQKPVLHLCGRHHFFRRFAPDNGIKVYANSPTVELFINGASQGRKDDGDYRLPAMTMTRKGVATPIPPAARLNHVFFWKSKLAPGRNVVEVSDGAGHRDRMVVYQRPADGPMPSDPKALVQDLASSNPASPALFVDRPVEAQAPFYTEVDGSSDNTFDVLPAAASGASWIGTRRLSDKNCKTDLSFRINPGSAGATVFVMFSTGTFPVVTLKKPDQRLVKTAAAFTRALTAAGFSDSGEKAVWRDHTLERADAALWSRVVKAGETVTIPGHTLDYVIMAKAKTEGQER